MGLAREITKLVKRLFRIEAAKIRTNTVCQVISYDATTNLATIQPCIQQIRTDDLDNINKALKPIEDVPVWQWGSGTVLATIAPVADSYGLYVVSDRRLENWITLGGIQPAGSAIKHDISSGFFLPGLWPNVTGEKISPAVDTTGFQIRTMDGTGYISLNATTGQVDISGNFTVDV